MDWLDSLIELDLVAELRELVAAAAGVDWLNSLTHLDLVAELHELVAAMRGMDLLGLAVLAVPLAWWLLCSWRIWNRPGHKGAGVVRTVLWGIIALVAGTVRFFVIMLVAFFGIVMLLGKLEGAGRCSCRW